MKKYEEEIMKEINNLEGELESLGLEPDIETTYFYEIENFKPIKNLIK